MCKNRLGSDDLFGEVACFSAHNLSHWHKHLRAYQPNIAGNITYNAGGFRTAWRSPA